MNVKPTIAISGATGFIGSALCAHFAQQGYSVIGFCRNIPVQPLQGVEYRYFSFEAGADVALFKDTDVFIHCAYLKGEEAKNLNIDGTKKLLEAARNAGAEKSIFFSSMSAQSYALSAYGQQKLQLEKEFSDKDDAAIRPGLVIGNGGLFAEMVRYIQTKKIVPLIDGGKQPLYTVHISDVMKAIEIIITENLNGTFTVAESQPVLYKDFYKELAAALNRKIILLPFSYSVLETVFSITDALGIKLSVGKENLLGLKAIKPLHFNADLEKLKLVPKTYRESFELITSKSGFQ